MNLNLWAEITISGIFYFLSIGFIFLRIIERYDLKFISLMVKDNFAVSTIIVLALSYFCGIVAHRLVSLFMSKVISKVYRKITFQKPRPKFDFENYETRINIWQNGSERLHKEIDFQFSILALLKSVFWGIPVLTFSITIWLMGAGTTEHLLSIWLLVLFILICIFIALRLQQKHYTELREATYKYLGSFRKSVGKKTI
jgi:hypothetical protein